MTLRLLESRHSNSHSSTFNSNQVDLSNVSQVRSYSINFQDDEPDGVSPIKDEIDGVEYQSISSEREPDLTGSGRETRCNRLPCHGKPCALVALLLTILLIVFFVLAVGISLALHIRFSTVSLQHLSHHFTQIIGANSTVLVGQKCFNSHWTKEVTISKQFNDPDIQFYRTSYVQYMPLLLPNKTLYVYHKNYGERKSANYMCCNNPIYTAKSGSITYIISTSSDNQFSNCPLQLFIFDNFTTYNEFLIDPNSISDNSGIYNKSKCVIGTNQVLQFSLQGNKFYYAAMNIVNNFDNHVSFSVDAFGSLTQINTNDLQPFNCSLQNLDTTPCTIPIPESTYTSSQLTCILAYSSSEKQFNITIDVALALTSRNINSITLAALLLFVVLTILSVLGVIVQVTMMVLQKRRKQTNDYCEIENA